MSIVSTSTGKWGAPYLALATDGDGTLMRGGRVGHGTVRALEKLRRFGIKIILTTGETPQDFKEFPHLDLFDYIVAENGGLLYDPGTRHEKPLGDEPPPELLRALRRKGVRPIKKGRVIVSTESSHEPAAAEVLKQLDIGWKVFRNRHSIMILPARINKATGLAAALPKFQLAPRQVVSVGDAENDLPMIKSCGLGVALNNAVPLLKEHADLITKHETGAGVVELIDHLFKGKVNKSN